jgi:hypothetical protein
MHSMNNIEFKKTPKNIWEMPSLNFCWGTGYPERDVPWFLCLMPNGQSN